MAGGECASRFKLLEQHVHIAGRRTRLLGVNGCDGLGQRLALTLAERSLDGLAFIEGHGKLL
ncbi:hypothetical protein D3C87_2038820 [compost metagenome]